MKQIKMDKNVIINHLNSAKLPELKQMAKLMEVKHTGRKLELKERLLEQLNSKEGLIRAQEYFGQTHPLPVSTLNAAAATETEIDMNGAKHKSENKEQQLQEADKSKLGEPEVFPGLAGYFLTTVTAGRIVLKITGKDKDWIKEAKIQLTIFFANFAHDKCMRVGRLINVCPCDKTLEKLEATAMPAPIEDEPMSEENSFFFDVVFGQDRLRIHGPTVEIVKAARHYLCGYFQHVKEVKHLAA